MSQNSALGTDTEKLVALFVGFAVAAMVLPVLVPRLGQGIAHWALAHHVLVPAAHAVFVIPGLGAGPDLRRVLIAAAVLVALAIAGAAVTRSVAANKASR